MAKTSSEADGGNGVVVDVYVGRIHGRRLGRHCHGYGMIARQFGFAPHQPKGISYEKDCASCILNSARYGNGERTKPIRSQRRVGRGQRTMQLRKYDQEAIDLSGRGRRDLYQSVRRLLSRGLGRVSYDPIRRLGDQCNGRQHVFDSVE